MNYQSEEKTISMLTIENGMSITSAQELFNQAFPFLKLEFFRKPHKRNAGSDKKQLLKPDGVLKSVSKGKNNQHILVNADLKVSDLEQLFQKNFGLSVQVFRKSGRSWLETTLTDDWTLRKQNQEGMELSSLRPGAK